MYYQVCIFTFSKQAKIIFYIEIFMTLRAYLVIMIFTTIVCWAAFGFIIISVNPEATNWIGFFLFYISLFLSLVGLVAIAGFLIRFVGLKYELAFRAVKDAFRQSFLFSAAVMIVLFLLSKNLFSWLNLILLIVGLSVLEFFLISYRMGQRRVGG